MLPKYPILNLVLFDFSGNFFVMILVASGKILKFFFYYNYSFLRQIFLRLFVMNTNLKIDLELSNLKILNIFDKIFPDIFRSSCSSRICSSLKIIRIRLITRFRVIIKSFFYE